MSTTNSEYTALSVLAAQTESGLVLIPIATLKTPPENEAIYAPVRPDDPEVARLAESIRQHGLLHPLTVSSDRYVIDGNRRLIACRLAGLEAVPCRLRSDLYRGHPDFIAVLREFNRQRVKTAAERIREEVATVEPAAAYARLLNYRDRDSRQAMDGSAAVAIGTARRRARISDAKAPMLDAVRRVLADRRDYWPLSDRQVHYALLNDPPLVHARKPGSLYRNDKPSYKSLCDLLTRARLSGDIPFTAITDSTRPHTGWTTWAEPGAYVQDRLNTLFRDYFRDLLQSQPNHVELWAEKLTVQTLVQRVAMQYTIPVTIGRGFASLDPRYRLAERFQAGGKTRLVLLVLTDHDPDGEQILDSLASSLRDEFSIRDLHVVKVAITGEQVASLHLPPSMEAKASSRNYAKFASRHGRFAYELEAIPPAELERIIHGAVQANLDMSQFRAEQAQEQRDAAEIEARRNVMVATLRERGEA